MNEAIYFDALRAIAREYQTPAQLRRSAEKHYGLPYEEVLEMAYENMQATATRAIHGKRRPKRNPPSTPGATSPKPSSQRTET